MFFQFSTYYLYTCYVLEQDEVSVREVSQLKSGVLSSLESFNFYRGKAELKHTIFKLHFITVYLLEISFNQDRSSVLCFLKSISGSRVRSLAVIEHKSQKKKAETFFLKEKLQRSFNFCHRNTCEAYLRLYKWAVISTFMLFFNII